MPQQKSREAESLRGLLYCKKLPNFYIYVHTLYSGCQELSGAGHKSVLKEVPLPDATGKLFS